VLLLPSLIAVLLGAFIAVRTGSLTSISDYPIAARSCNAAVSYATFLAKTVYPVKLLMLRPYPADVDMLRLCASIVVLGTITILAIKNRCKHPYALIGWLWYLLTMLPGAVIAKEGFPDTACSHSYIPLIGIYIIGAWAGNAVLDRFICARCSALTYLLPIALAAALTVNATNLSKHWKDSAALSYFILSVNPNIASAHNNLGAAMREESQHALALQHFRAAVQIAPAYSDARRNLAFFSFASPKALCVPREPTLSV